MSLADELKKLAELKDAGVLTQDEFDSQKQKLLADRESTAQTPTPDTHDEEMERWVQKRKADKRARLIGMVFVALIVVGGVGIFIQSRTGGPTAKERAAAAEAMMQATSPGNIRIETTKKQNEK